MDRLVTLLVALAVAFAAGVGWEHRPPIGWHARVLLWPVGFDLPDGLLTHRDHARAALAKALAQAAAVGARRTAITAAARPIEAKHQTEIEVRYRTLRERVTEYVPLHTPPGVIGADDLVPGRTLLLLDAAARGEALDGVSVTTGQSYEAASRLRFSALIDNYVLNLGIGHQVRRQLLDAQDWAADQAAADPPN